MNTPPRKTPARPLDWKNGRIDLSHGAGGRATLQLIDALFAPAFANPALAGALRGGDDGAVLTLPESASPTSGRLVLSTDAHVVSPLFFPGGDIGALAVHGTVNDVAVMGATPLWLSASFILEEGFPLADLRRIAQSMGQAARDCGIAIVCGDTKVVERGKGDGVFISTTGAGWLPAGRDISGTRAQAGDAVLLSGPMGEHGLAILACREGLEFETPIVSDSAALNGLIAGLLDAAPHVHVLRDPTRGGVATTLNEIAWQSGVGIVLDEAALPVQPAVAAACEFLGLDPLYAACEGRVLVICPAADADAALAALRAHPQGKAAARIGEVIEDPQRFVQMRTRLGGSRVVDWLTGDQLPRIC